jgi:hypothetical protein
VEASISRTGLCAKRRFSAPVSANAATFVPRKLSGTNR